MTAVSIIGFVLGFWFGAAATLGTQALRGHLAYRRDVRRRLFEGERL